MSLLDGMGPAGSEVRLTLFSLMLLRVRVDSEQHNELHCVAKSMRRPVHHTHKVGSAQPYRMSLYAVALQFPFTGARPVLA